MAGRDAQNFCNSAMQALAFDRLDQVAGGAERHAAPLLVGDGDHDHRRVGELGVLPQRRQHRPAVEVGHHHVERDRDRPQLLGNLDPFETAARGRDRKAFRFEMIVDQVARGRVVVDDENAVTAWRRELALSGCDRDLAAGPAVER